MQFVAMLFCVVVVYAADQVPDLTGKDAATFQAHPGLGISLVSFVGVTVLTFLELLVAFIQAFVFTFLTTVFLSGAVHPDH